MTIAISCPACGASYNLNDQMRGKTVRCKSCQETFPVNGSSKSAPTGIKKGATPARPMPASKSDPDDEPVKKKGGKGLLIAGGIVGVLFLLCCGGISGGVYYAYTGTKSAVDKFDKEFAEQMKKGGGDPKDFESAMKQAGAQFDAAIKQAEEEAKKNQQGNKPSGDSGKKPPGGDSATKPPSGDSGTKPPKQPDPKDVDAAMKKAEEELNKKFGVKNEKEVKSIDDALTNLKSSDKNKQRQAAEWLGKASLDKGRQDEVAKTLDPLLSEKDSFWLALNALQVWATKDNVPSLAKLLDTDSLQGVPGDGNHKAMQILGKLQDERGAAAVARFMQNFFSRESAVNSLRAMGPVAEKAVLKYFKHGDGGVHGAVDSLLRGYGTKTSAIALQCVDDAQNATDQSDRTRVLD